MDSLKELVTFLKTRSEPIGFGELKTIFNDEVELKGFIKAGLENGVIQKEGEKRGTKYFVGDKGSVVKVKENDDDAYFEKANDIEVYLKSDKPCVGQPFLTTTTPFGDGGPSIKKFLASGVRIENHTIGYDKKIKKNVILDHQDRRVFNQIAIKREGTRNFIFQKIHAITLKIEEESFSTYEQLREHIRINFV